eukprot:TRINITY_DN1418_c0_g1_i10.p1 TRINITY_DN1418_c0_g1~~TRINITY_DN1418_c0_g1_i10.p1  ORF type:complete len:111 (-),score=25.97 TRINITY_DN1418_c0_g1_i10:206-538(-)
MQAFQKDAEAKGGKIKFEDFKAYVEEASKKEKSYDDIEYAFKVFAKESKDTKEASIPVVTLKQYLTTLGDKLTGRQVDDFLTQAEVSGSGAITLAQFMKVVKTSTLEDLK